MKDPRAVAAAGEVSATHGDVTVTEYVPPSGKTCWSVKGPNGTYLVTPGRQVDQVQVWKSDSVAPARSHADLARGIRAAAGLASSTPASSSASTGEGAAPAAGGSLAPAYSDVGVQDSGAPAGGGAQQCPDCGQFMGPSHTCPTPEGLPAGDYGSIKDRDARVKAMVGDLETAVQAVVESGQLHRWLDAMASNGMNRWSANNRLLAVVQMLQRGESIEGLHMMGFRQWQDKHNRKVRKGAKAIWILAPMTRTIEEEDENGKLVKRSRVVGFKSVPVFNVADTEGDPMPGPLTRPAPGEATPGTLEGLRNRVGQAGYAYEETEIPDCRPATGEGTLGYTDPKSQRIVVDSRLSNAQKASTIAHELGHVHCGHVDQDYSVYRQHRGRMETEAEATAFLVNSSRGMSHDQVNSFSPGYIAGWAGGNPKIVHAAMERAVKAHQKIMDGDWPGEGTK